ncbi:MAG: hypothetical protein CL967_05550 [Euryarchaeota archaeon]|nr:hypothetical protein [Euryarchaeota archaeon]|tara:strand:+ start:3134 stop:3727 length:594 start_codon:yes stop_codon:yes gene_type:complete
MSKKRKRAASLSQDDIVFAFLSARVLCGNRDFMGDVKLGVGFAPKGHVAAKLHANNNNQFALRKPSWKILLGFHCTVQAWKKYVKGPWSRCVQKNKKDWETSVREGLKLAYRYCDDQAVYVSCEAQSTPESSLLQRMQALCKVPKRRVKRKARGVKFEFWKLVLSKKSIGNISKEIAKQSARSARSTRDTRDTRDTR